MCAVLCLIVSNLFSPTLSFHVMLQIRDLKVYVEAQKMVTSMKDSDSFVGGTVLPVESNQLSSGNAKRRIKSGRRRT